MKTLTKFLSIALILISVSACMQMQILALNQAELTRFHTEGNKMFLMGLLNSNTLAQMNEALVAQPEVDTLVFTAMPGSIDDETTFAVGRLIRQRGLNTHLLSNSAIASGAVDLFLAGTNRTAERGAQIGVHSWSDGERQAKDIPRESEEHRLNADYIADMLGNEAFYWFTIYAAPADEIQFMNEFEIREYGLLTAPLLAPSNTAVPFGDEFEEARRDVLDGN